MASNLNGISPKESMALSDTLSTYSQFVSKSILFVTDKL